ncbi:MAG: PKD domain-containing protein [Bacteroidales bacterium]|nr:PKD domain-containing protein [Bacteroidales bacterium]
MKKFTLLFCSVLLILLSSSAFSQKSWGGLPVSFTNKNLSSNVDRVVLPQPDMTMIMQEDAQDEKNGELYKVGRIIPTNISIENSGTWDILEDGTKIWRLEIACRDAQALMLLYNNFNLVEGSQLFLYNENRKQLLGYFDHRTNPTNSSYFSTQMIQGEITNLELVIQSDVNPDEIALEIEAVMYNYRSVDQFIGQYKDGKPTGFGDSGACNVNINCPEGDNWQTEKKGVAEIFVIQGAGGGFCSGSLVNNTAQDGTPYFLTADHCGGDATAAEFAQWQFYFHFESANCSNPGTEPAYETITGSEFRARGPMTGGTDFLLLELNTTQANLAAIDAYYNGWDRSTTPSAAGVCIHHPSGDIKKISTYTAALTIESYPGCQANSHWHANWVETATSWGITEGGSSGSPLFKGANKLIVGTETGGASACGVSAANAWDEYGMFSQHWTSNGTGDDDQLRPWLDPTDSDAQSLNGFDPNATAGDAPVADFVGNPTVVVEGGTVDFTDLSTNNPTSWSWNFPGGTPATSPAQNPSVVYNTAGTYDVTLTATNSDGSDTETKTLYIEVIADGTLAANFSADQTVVTEGDDVNFTDESMGDVTTWSWEFEGGTPPTSPDQNPTVNYPTAGVYSVTLTVSDGTDSDDEIRTGYITVTDGSGSLTAAFIASAYTITAGNCINFNDQSVGLPTSWSWSFPGAATTTSTNQHPTNICYNTPGIYDVVLQVQNATDQDTYICEDCITVNPDPSVPIADFEANVLTIPVGGVVLFTNLSQNGPFNQWSWVFEGGSPSTFADSAPPPIAYMTPGLYDVELRCRKTNNVQDIEIKYDYIHVIPAATSAPTANFTANNTVIQPGEQINFIDLSSGLPYQWSWEFEGGVPATSNQQNPIGIQYDTEGVYNVTLTVSNNFGLDVLTKELYITVSETDPCTEAPTADFTAVPRLIAAGESVHFQDLSTGLPSTHTWSFAGASPSYSSEGSPTNAITYATAGIYDVTLTVSNSCGADVLTKENYIYVFSGSVQQYCDTLTTVNPGETVQTWVPTGTWGFMAGHNGDNIKKYANYFSSYTFSQINGVIIPVTYAMYGAYSNSVKFCIWEGTPDGPVDSLKLGEKRVYIRDLTANQSNVIQFDTPITIDGPFYAGFEISYKDDDNNGQNDDLFVVPIVTSRGINPANNNLYLQKSGVWYTNNDLYNFSSAIPIKPITCLTDIENLLTETGFDVYPNPTSGIVNIKVLNQAYDISAIEIYDALGRKSVIDAANYGPYEYTLDMQSYSEGLYIIRIKSGKYVINKKIILSK